MMDILPLIILILAVVLYKAFVEDDSPKPSSVTRIEYFTVGQAWYLLCLRDGFFGATPGRHNALLRWNNSGRKGIVRLPKLGFEEWAEYQTALQLCENKDWARENNIEIRFDKYDVERVWRVGYDKSHYVTG